MTILKAVQNKLTKVKVFEDAYMDVKEALKNGISACERWTECCRNLTKSYWKNYGPHTWDGGEFVPKSVVNFSKRLREVLGSIE